MRDFQDFCIRHYQDIRIYVQKKGLPGPGNQGIGALGRELDAATVSWVAAKAQDETGTNIGTVLKEHIGDRIAQALDMHRGRGENDYFLSLPGDTGHRMQGQAGRG